MAVPVSTCREEFYVEKMDYLVGLNKKFITFL